MDDEIAEFGDGAGLTKLYERAVDRIRHTVADEKRREAWLYALEWQDEQAISHFYELTNDSLCTARPVGIRHIGPEPGN
jgi:hypothetical protein